MIRNLGTHTAWLLNIHGYHTPQLQNIAILVMAFSFQNFKMLPTLHMEFFRSVIPLNFFFFKTGKNNLSIIITIVGNINVLVSHNVIFFGYFMPETWCQLEDSSNCLPPIALSPFRFSPGLSVVLLKILSQPSFALIKLFAKNNIFSK